MKRILNVLLGLVFALLGLFAALAGGNRFIRALTAMAERPLQGDESVFYLKHAVIGFALLVFGLWALKAAWARLKQGLQRAPAAQSAAPEPVTETPVAPVTQAGTVLRLSHGGKIVRLTQQSGESILGRGQDCALVVASKHVSRAHAKVVWDASGEPRLANLSNGGTSVCLKGEADYRACDPELALQGEGSIALASDGPAAAERGELIAFEVSRG